MALVDHLRELRNRFLVAGGAIVLGTIPGWLLYTPVLNALIVPLRTQGATVNLGGITDPFAVQMQVSIWIALLATSPVWLYEIWAFVVPGLTKREKRTAAAFLATSVPLLLAGSYLGYLTLPKAIEILLGFTPDEANNIIPLSDYLGFATRFILAFGLSFLLPVFLVALNLIHVLKGRQMLAAWRWAIILIFIFAAVLTPTPDPWTMLSLAIPMDGLYFAACGLSVLFDRARSRRDKETYGDFSHLADDEASPL